MSQRMERVDELLREEIGRILARDVQDPRIGFATITDVETTPDLRHAQVWVSVIGREPERQETLAALQRAMGFVRHELGRRLRLKRIPDLHVRLDESSERGTRLLRLLAELEEGHVPEDLPEGETLPTPVARIGLPGDAPEPDAGSAEVQAQDSRPLPVGGPGQPARRHGASGSGRPRTRATDRAHRSDDRGGRRGHGSPGRGGRSHGPIRRGPGGGEPGR